MPGSGLGTNCVEGEEVTQNTMAAGEPLGRIDEGRMKKMKNKGTKALHALPLHTRTCKIHVVFIYVYNLYKEFI